MQEKEKVNEIGKIREEREVKEEKKKEKHGGKKRKERKKRKGDILLDKKWKIEGMNPLEASLMIFSSLRGILQGVSHFHKGQQFHGPGTVGSFSLYVLPPSPPTLSPFLPLLPSPLSSSTTTCPSTHSGLKRYEIDTFIP